MTLELAREQLERVLLGPYPHEINIEHEKEQITSENTLHTEANDSEGTNC